ncbi:MAG: prolyl aminopeptidase [Rhodospirillaceae bacterium]|nr:prolyl aminopeptidase [Rhodospirillaceae bacterium]MBT5240127.1 prolyl aminopeptidase [Rhodospirillaceae bacterium]MBT5566906.1 prolyl aminopeptidase [Rhodospirillaceae bacterium]MBT6090407.1 prolyl aminopeptidase [Rhodospirillaceae bacterium]MBT6961182.1 prolyl aminopeptidase [Rhodospirillaceae bacterium]
MGPSSGSKQQDAHPLYPTIECRKSGFLRADKVHRLYWEESGNKKGVPVVFLHGGPGAGTAPTYRRFFDPNHYRIILIDQRGSGRSTPEAETQDNTTEHLVSDLELVRDHLEIERWIVFGGSWGSTLALAYGQAHSDRCIGFILRGVFLFSSEEINWFLSGMGRFFPEAWRAFANHIPVNERHDLLTAYTARLMDPSPEIHRPAAAAWCAYENSCSRLMPTSRKTSRNDAYYSGALAMARIEAHYMTNNGFLRPNQLLDGMTALKNHPAIIVQGRYDMVCPIQAADRLAQIWDGAAYRIIPDAGHSSLEPGIRSALITATDEFRGLT